MNLPFHGGLFLTLGIIMVLTGISLFVFWFNRHWSRRKQDRQETHGAGEFMMANAFFHFGMLILTIGGVSLIVVNLR